MGNAASDGIAINKQICLELKQTEESTLQSNVPVVSINAVAVRFTHRNVSEMLAEIKEAHAAASFDAQTKKKAARLRQKEQKGIRVFLLRMTPFGIDLGLTRRSLHATRCNLPGVGASWRHTPPWPRAKSPASPGT